MSGDLLVVDDSAQNLEVLSTLLTAHGHSVRTACGGLEALRLAHEQPPDLVLLDVHMPDLNGFEVCRSLRAKWDSSTMPVVFLSGANEPENKVKAFQLGAIDFVTKPFHFPEVLARVDVHLELKRRTTQLEASNTRLQQIEAARRRFITSLVHDIKNPLTPMLKNTEWLLEQPIGDEEVREVTRDVHVASNHLHRMVLSLLDVARVDEHGLMVTPELIKASRWLDEALTLTRLQLRSQPGRLTVRCNDGHAFLDPAVMGRVLQNLLDNAIKYTPRQHPISIDCEVSKLGELTLVVEDRGPGIKPEDRERIFDAWVRLDAQSAPLARTSHGIGLAFCRHAVQSHGGTLTVEEAQPHGARFVLKLPGVS